MKKERKLTAKGYVRLFRKNRHKFEHVIVWEQHFGEVPAGMQIHHIDGDKTNNHISNLQLVTPLDHKRLHEGCKLVSGEWHKPCKDCGEFKKCCPENWYYSRGWINSRLCRPCFIKKSMATRKALIARGWKRNYTKKAA